jgi:hypothetical protein
MGISHQPNNRNYWARILSIFLTWFGSGNLEKTTESAVFFPISLQQIVSRALFWISVHDGMPATTLLLGIKSSNNRSPTRSLKSSIRLNIVVNTNMEKEALVRGGNDVGMRQSEKKNFLV